MARSVYIINIDYEHDRGDRVFGSATRALEKLSEYGQIYTETPLEDLYSGQEVWVDGQEVYAKRTFIK